MPSTDQDRSRPPVETFWTGVDPVAALGACLLPVFMLIAMVGLWSLADAREQQRRELAAAATPRPVKLDAVAYARGQQLYAMACLACHGPQGQGVPGLGKDLVKSRFSRALDDAQLAAFISAGRAADDPLNTSKVPMPPKGGRADFSNQNIADVVAFLRGLSDPRRVPDGPLPEVEIVLGDAPPEPVASASAAQAAPAPAPASPAAAAAPTASVSAPPAAAAAIAIDPQAVARGKKAYISCMACHGKDGKGVKNMGKTLVDSPFVAKLDDKALADFIKKGRGPTDAENTTKIAMPPKGGNPALKDEQIKDIVAYIRSLNGGAVAAASAATPTPTPAPAASAAPAAKPAAPAPVTPVASASPAPAPVAAATIAPAPARSLAAASTGDPIARGKKAYISCIACHGKDGTGVKNMGKDLVNSPFVARLADQALVDFIKKGRGPTDPDNTTKIGMPPKGGNPALKDEQIKDIVSYIRSLRQTPSASAQ